MYCEGRGKLQLYLHCAAETRGDIKRLAIGRGAGKPSGLFITIGARKVSRVCVSPRVREKITINGESFIAVQGKQI